MCVDKNIKQFDRALIGEFERDHQILLAKEWPNTKHLYCFTNKVFQFFWLKIHQRSKSPYRES